MTFRFLRSSAGWKVLERTRGLANLAFGRTRSGGPRVRADAIRLSLGLDGFVVIDTKASVAM